MGLLPPTNARNDYASLVGFMESGIDHCRAGRWDKGVEYLSYVAEREPRGLDEAGLFLSYLGCAVARTKGQAGDGLALCEQAVQVEFYQPENWANLAEVLLLLQLRREAVSAVRQGLQIDPQNERLQELAESLGRRRRPVLRILSRRNAVNRILGRLRSDILGSRAC